MYAVADTDSLVADGTITREQARAIETRAREAMVMIGVNVLLLGGIIAAAAGLIYWLASAMAVAICGVFALVAGILILMRGSELFRMFGNAAALIGAGMLIGGAALELIDKHENIAGWTMIVAGAVIALIAGWVLSRPDYGSRLVTGSIFLMGLAMHVAGLAYLLHQHVVSGLPVSAFYLYTAAVMAGAGWFTNVRLVTALSIVPFAQVLDTGTFYFYAAYVFYSPEPTLSILQMALLIGLCLWLAGRAGERTARHARVLAVLAFVVANLCALVGSLWGDVVGQTVWGPGDYWHAREAGTTYDQWSQLVWAFEREALTISEQLYSVMWAVALAAMVFWAAYRNQRALFNAALTFGAIHAYTQLFESFGDEPLAFAIAGLAAIPLAWVMWRLNQWLVERSQADQLGAT